MFSTYSWTEHLPAYLVTVVVLCIVYYCYVMYRYFPNERKTFFSRNGKSEDSSDEYTPNGGSDHDHSEAVTGYNDSPVNDTDALIGMIKRLVTDSITKNYTRSDLLLYLKGTFQQFPDLNEPVFRSTINEFVVGELESRGTILLKEDEVDLLWD